MTLAAGLAMGFRLVVAFVDVPELFDQIMVDANSCRLMVLTVPFTGATQHTTEGGENDALVSCPASGW